MCCYEFLSRATYVTCRILSTSLFSGRWISFDFSVAEAKTDEARALSPKNRKLLGPPPLPCFALSDLPDRAFSTY